MQQLCVYKDSRMILLIAAQKCLGSITQLSLHRTIIGQETEQRNAMRKFRTNKLAYTADIPKAFLHVGLLKQDRNAEI